MNDDQRAEARDVIAAAFEALDGTTPYTRADMLLDALTKPRTEKCPAGCMKDGVGVWVVYGSDGWVPCPTCSGSGTVTRGPIAVLVGEFERAGFSVANGGEPLYRRTGEGDGI